MNSSYHPRLLKNTSSFFNAGQGTAPIAKYSFFAASMMLQ